MFFVTKEHSLEPLNLGYCSSLTILLTPLGLVAQFLAQVSGNVHRL